jgi:hypothetical protein
MSLTVALAILGAVVLAAVVAHGVWSARRAGPRQATAGGAGSEARAAERVEPTLSHAPASGAAPPSPLTPIEAKRRSAARLDPLIDAIVPLALEQPVSGELVLLHLPATRRAGSKPFLVEGLNADSGDWETPAPGRRYSELQAGVQMANRGGAINEIEYSEFVQKMQAFADAIGASAEPPDMLDVAARARELDAFASSHDAQLAVRLKANGTAWSVGFLTQHAARHGFVSGAVPGRLVHPGTDGDDAAAPPMLVLAFDPQAALAEDPAQAAVSSATLALDVPQTEAAAEPFAAWQQAARMLAADLDATLVDDAGQPLQLHGFVAIGKELGQLYSTLEARDLAAGSAAARRLFS